MKFSYCAAIAVALVLAGYTYSVSRYNEALAERLVTLEIGQAHAADKLQQQFTTLHNSMSTATVAAKILETDNEALAKAVADNLMENADSLQQLTGPQGPMPELGQVIAYLEEQGFGEHVIEGLWNTHKDHFLQSPALIATVADAVYSKYGYSLRGENAPALSAESVARMVAQEPGFASMVGRELARNDEVK